VQEAEVCQGKRPDYPYQVEPIEAIELRVFQQDYPEKVLQQAGEGRRPQHQLTDLP